MAASDFREFLPLILAWIDEAADSSDGSFAFAAAAACSSALALAAFAFRSARPLILAWIEEAAPSFDGIAKGVSTPRRHRDPTGPQPNCGAQEF